MPEKIEIGKDYSPIEEVVNYNPHARVSFARGHNVWLEGVKRPYTDLIMGYSSTNFGHANPEIINFVVEAASLYDNVIAFGSRARIELDQKLTGHLDPGPQRFVYYPVGGSKTVESAIKLARAYTRKDGIISFKGGFHGYSFGAMIATDDQFVNKKQFEPLPGKTIGFPFPNRKSLHSEKEANITVALLGNYLRDHHQSIAALVFEPLQGAAGFISPPEGFLNQILTLTKQYNVISICDEIQTSIYRTGTFYNHTKSQLHPDIVLVGKSLAGGYYPLGAMIAPKDFFQSVDSSLSGFDSTFSGNLFGVHIANRTLEYASDIKIEDKVKQTGQLMMESVLRLGVLPAVDDIDGEGMAFRFKLVSKDSNLQKGKQMARELRKKAFDNYLILQTAGVNGDYIKLSPSFLMDATEFNEAMLVIGDCIQEISV